MTIHASLYIYNSKADIYGNRYWAFSYVDHESGKEVMGTTTGGESNISAITFGWSTPKEYDRGIMVHREEMPIRAFNRLVKGWPYGGCDPKDIAAFIKAKLNPAND